MSAKRGQAPPRRSNCSGLPTGSNRSRRRQHFVLHSGSRTPPGPGVVGAHAQAGRELGNDFAGAGIPDLKLHDIFGHADLGHDADQGLIGAGAAWRSALRSRCSSAGPALSRRRCRRRRCRSRCSGPIAGAAACASAVDWARKVNSSGLEPSSAAALNSSISNGNTAILIGSAAAAAAEPVQQQRTKAARPSLQEVKAAVRTRSINDHLRTRAGGAADSVGRRYIAIANPQCRAVVQATRAAGPGKAALPSTGSLPKAFQACFESRNLARGKSH